MRVIAPILIAIAAGYLGGFLLWHVVGFSGALVADSSGGVRAALLAVVATSAGVAAWHAGQRPSA
jgi:hypothetical protein